MTKKDPNQQGKNKPYSGVVRKHVTPFMPGTKRKPSWPGNGPQLLLKEGNLLMLLSSVDILEKNEYTGFATSRGTKTISASTSVMGMRDLSRCTLFGDKWVKAVNVGECEKILMGLWRAPAMFLCSETFISSPAIVKGSIIWAGIGFCDVIESFLLDLRKGETESGQTWWVKKHETDILLSKMEKPVTMDTAF